MFFDSSCWMENLRPSLPGEVHRLSDAGRDGVPANHRNIKITIKYMQQSVLTKIY